MAGWEGVGQWSWLRVRWEMGEREAIEWLLLVSTDCDWSWRDWPMSDCCIAARRRREGRHRVGMRWSDPSGRVTNQSPRDSSSAKSIR